MYVYVAYNKFGDLVAEHCSYWSLVWLLEAMGYDPEMDAFIGRVSP